MRQEGVRVASGRRQDNLASGWRQDDVKRRGARINYPVLLSYTTLPGACGGPQAHHTGPRRPPCQQARVCYAEPNLPRRTERPDTTAQAEPP